MSAAAASSPTRGFAQVPNSLIENQTLLTRSELALALIVLRRDENDTLTDGHWTKWTGLSPRQKEYAVAGLREKGLVVKGRGNLARYGFARDQWDGFVRTVNRGAHKARTIGRAVNPKPGAKIHSQCRERGCALLSATSCEDNAQPVAQGDYNPPPSGEQSSKQLIPLLSMPNAQRVARTVADGAEQLWSKTLAALQVLFPLVGVAFLVRLVAVVRAVFADVRDEELAAAVRFAFDQRKGIQKSEGLFLLTVPAAVQALRRRKNHAPGMPTEGPQDPHLAAGVRMLLDGVAEGLRARGAPFEAYLAEVTKLRDTVRDNAGVLEGAEQTMNELETRIIQTGRETLTVDERLTVEGQVTAELVRYEKNHMPKVQLAALRDKLTGREILQVLNIPRLSLFYA